MPKISEPTPQLRKIGKVDAQISLLKILEQLKRIYSKELVAMRKKMNQTPLKTKHLLQLQVPSVVNKSKVSRSQLRSLEKMRLINRQKNQWQTEDKVFLHVKVSHLPTCQTLRLLK